MISHKHKFLSIRIPKTGSTSITKALEKYFDECGVGDRNSPYFYHQPASNLKDHFESENWNWDEYFKFTFVRNPWDRLVSMFFYQHTRYKILCKKKLEDTDPFTKKMVQFKSVESLVYSLATNSTVCPSSPYEHWFLTDGKMGLDFIGKTENLQGDFNTICDKIGIPRQELPHKNKSKHKSYTEYYDDETKSIVAEKYAKDIEYFGYKFGE